ncbi:hypothetical protein [uncultured Vagococcus sp.]|uniref:hypothetical protein n=1 Tax=uncultured Vagococcus sp. TaxID=189676 RepID=UPI002590B360|nr:hypothetical protein [uncultured Vagococcus sp.]
MNSEEARMKIEQLANQLKYEQNLIERSNGYVNSKQTADSAKEMIKSLYTEIEELRKYL